VSKVDRYWYFAYGSNMDSARIKSRLGYIPSHKIAILSDYRFGYQKAASHKGRMGFATVVKHTGQKVWGKAFAITKDDLASLDGFEGVPYSYKRDLVPLKTKDGQELKAVIYLPAQYNRKKLFPRRDYLAHIIKGGKELPQDYVNKIVLLGLEYFNKYSDSQFNSKKHKDRFDNDTKSVKPGKVIYLPSLPTNGHGLRNPRLLVNTAPRGPVLDESGFLVGPDSV